MNFYRDAGDLIFGTRLKRLSDRFLQDVARVYKQLNIPFEISWFPLFYLLNKNDLLSVTEIASELKITHSAVSQLAATIKEKGYIDFKKDKNDGRRKLISLTGQGQELLQQLKPVWDAIHSAMTALISAGEYSAALLPALEELENRISKYPIQERILNELNGAGTGLRPAIQEIKEEQ